MRSEAVEISAAVFIARGRGVDDLVNEVLQSFSLKHDCLQSNWRIVI
jgi:hypothetical protein